MLPLRVLTLRGSVVLTELWVERAGGGSGGQEAEITEVTPPCLERCLGWVVLSTKTGRDCRCQPVIEVRQLD